MEYLTSAVFGPKLGRADPASKSHTFSDRSTQALCAELSQVTCLAGAQGMRIRMTSRKKEKHPQLVVSFQGAKAWAPQAHSISRSSRDIGQVDLAVAVGLGLTAGPFMAFPAAEENRGAAKRRLWAAKSWDTGFFGLRIFVGRVWLRPFFLIYIYIYYVLPIKSNRLSISGNPRA